MILKVNSCTYFFKHNANTYLLRNYCCWKQQNEMAMHDGTFYKINMSNIINAFVYGPHPPQYHTILVTNFSPTFLILSSKEATLCAARYVIQTRMSFQDGGHFLQSRQQTSLDTCSSSQQPLSKRRCWSNIRPLHLSALNHKVMSLSDLSPLKHNHYST